MMKKDTFYCSCLFVFLLSTFLITINAVRRNSFQEEFGMGYRAHGKGSKVIRETNFGVQKQLKKLEKFIELHKNVKKAKGISMRMKASRSRKLQEVKKRVRYLKDYQSSIDAVRKAKPGLSQGTYNDEATQKIEQIHPLGAPVSEKGKSRLFRPVGIEQAPQKLSPVHQVLPSAPQGISPASRGSSSARNTSPEMHKESPDSVMSRHFKNWKSPESE